VLKLQAEWNNLEIEKQLDICADDLRALIGPDDESENEKSNFAELLQLMMSLKTGWWFGYEATFYVRS